MITASELLAKLKGLQAEQIRILGEMDAKIHEAESGNFDYAIRVDLARQRLEWVSHFNGQITECRQKYEAAVIREGNERSGFVPR